MSNICLQPCCVLDIFEKTRSFKTTPYKKYTINSSYFVTLLDLYLQRRNNANGVVSPNFKYDQHVEELPLLQNPQLDYKVQTRKQVILAQQKEARLLKGLRWTPKTGPQVK